MSRRARIEEEKQRKFSDELEEEENRLKAQRERIYAPMIWRRLGSGIRIEDLKPKHYEDVLRIIEEFYFQEEVLSRNANIAEDPQSVKSFLKMVLFYLKDNTSIIALDELNEDKIAAFLILKTTNKKDHDNVFERAFSVEGEALKKIMAFVDNIARKSDVFEAFNCSVYLKYFLLLVTPECNDKGLQLQLMLSGADVARSLQIPAISGIFTSFAEQKLAKNTGMKVVNEIYYVNWCDKFNNMIFEDPGIGNYTCALMAGLVPPPPVVEPSPKTDEQKPQLTREQKRKDKEKKQKKLNKSSI